MVVTVLVVLGGELTQSPAEDSLLDQLTRVLTPADFQHAEDPVTQMVLVTDQARALVRDDDFYKEHKDI